MIAIKGRKIVNLNGDVPPPDPDPEFLEVTVTFATAPSSASSAFPKFKHNKSKAILMEFDDDSVGVLTAYQKLVNASYTDGCGNNKNYSLGLAVNAKNNFNNAEWGDNYPGKVTYAQRAALIPLGLDIMNHSYYHEPTGNFNNGNNVVKNFVDNDLFILDKDKYKMNMLVVPTNYTGYQLAAKDFGYLAGASEGMFDGLTPYPSQFNALGSIANMPKANYTAIKRTFSDNWTNSGPQWAAINSFFANSALDYFEIGSHGIGDGVNFNSWIDSIITQANDTILFQSLREFMEYKHLRENVTKSELLSSTTLKITLDYSTVPNQNISWFDLSLLITSDKSVVAVTTNDNSFAISYNTSTKLINVSKRKTVWP